MVRFLGDLYLTLLSRDSRLRGNDGNSIRHPHEGGDLVVPRMNFRDSRPRENDSGFTLVELIITLIIFMILSAFTIGNFNSFIQKSTYHVESARLMHAIQLARNEAILHHHRVIFCKSKNQKTCSGNWQDGYLILSDNKPIYSFLSNSKGTLNWRAFPNFSNNLEFLADGSADFQNGTFWYCPEHTKNPVWAIMISKSGRARLILSDEKQKEINCEYD